MSTKKISLKAFRRLKKIPPSQKLSITPSFTIGESDSKFGIKTSDSTLEEYFDFCMNRNGVPYTKFKDSTSDEKKLKIMESILAVARKSIKKSK